MDASDWAVWFGVGLGGGSLLLQCWQHASRRPKLDISGRITGDMEVRRRFSFVSVDVYNKGDSAVSIESVSASQGGVDLRCHVCVYRYGRLLHPEATCPIAIPPNGHEIFEVHCFPASERGAEFDPTKSVTIRLRASHSRREFALDVPGIDQPREWLKGKLDAVEDQERTHRQDVSGT